MIDFIVEHIWIFVIVGAVIILTVIGYIVDKFVINKDSKPNPKTEDDEIISEENNVIQDNQNENLVKTEAIVEPQDNPEIVAHKESDDVIEKIEDVEDKVPNSKEEKSDNKNTPWEV